MLKWRLIIIFLFYLLYSSCTQKKVESKHLEMALGNSGINRSELQKVLSKYRKNSDDSLKYLSAIFLIENMPGYHSYNGEQISEYKNYFKALRESKQEPIPILDSIILEYGYFDLTKSEKKYDLLVIDSAFIVENIELAFEAWENFPWSRNYTFDEFCEYILPYRVENEVLTPWRSIFLDRYRNLVAELETPDPIVVAEFLREHVINNVGSPRFTMTRPKGYPFLDPLTANVLAGSCDDISQFAIALFRAFGIACSKDYMPVRGTGNVGHSWVTLINHKKEYYYTDFFGSINYISEYSGNRAATKNKVFRRNFSKNRIDFDQLDQSGIIIPPQFSSHNYRFTDVTYLYSNHLVDITLEPSTLYPRPDHTPIAFLCAPSWLDWVPVSWSKFAKDGSVTFEEIEAGNILRVAYFDDNGIQFLSSPFSIHKQTREVVFYDTNDMRGNITLFSKFSVDKDIQFGDRMKEGVFEGSDNIDFRNSDTLHLITTRPSRLFTEVPIKTSKEYKFLRYRGGNSSHSNVAEIEFLTENGKVQGKAIGKPGAWQNNENYEYFAALDNNILTSYDHSTHNKGWVGLQLDSAVIVTGIRYAPRNYGNYIIPGDDYELFVSSVNGWQSLGRKKVDADSILYKDVPMNALFYLKNHSGGVEERVFVIQDGKQVFK